MRTLTSCFRSLGLGALALCLLFAVGCPVTPPTLDDFVRVQMQRAGVPGMAACIVKGDEVVLKVDEATNTKIKVSASAIGKNLSQEGKE